MAKRIGSENETGDWRGAMLERIRRIIRQADPDAVEESHETSVSPGVTRPAAGPSG